MVGRQGVAVELQGKLVVGVRVHLAAREQGLQQLASSVAASFIGPQKIRSKIRN